jgi:hypothetical protein
MSTHHPSRPSSFRGALLLAALTATLGLSAGCYYDDGWSYSVSVNAVADNETVFTGLTVTLSSDYDIDDATVYITEQDWGVTSAPADAVFALNEDGREATFTPVTTGTYVVRYRTWYYTNWDYDACYCTHHTSYRESYVTITVLAAPPG